MLGKLQPAGRSNTRGDMELDKTQKKRVFDLCLKDLESSSHGDLASLKRAIYAVKWLEGEKKLLEPLLNLLEKGAAEIRIGVIECLGHLKLTDCIEPLISQIERSFEMEDEEKSRAIREEAIRALATNGQEGAIDYLESVMHERIHCGMWSEDERSLAVESLTRFALSGSMRALEILSDGLDAPDRFIKELARESMLEISERRFWLGRGYHSFTARFEEEKNGDEAGKE